MKKIKNTKAMKQAGGDYTMKKHSFKKILFFLLLLTIPAWAQEEGFFFQYDNGPNDLCGVASLELADGGFIIASFDFHHEWEYYYHDTTAAQLFRLSVEGELIDKKRINEAGRRSTITGLFADPMDPNLFYAVGKIRAVNNLCDKPYMVKFDANLNILFTKEFDLPEQIPNLYYGRSFMDTHGDIVCFSLPIYDNGYSPVTNGHVYMRFGCNGELLTFFHDELNSVYSEEGAMCEVLDGSGDYAHLTMQRADDDNRMVVRRMDRDFHLLETYPFELVAFQTGFGSGYADFDYLDFITMLPAEGDSVWISTQVIAPFFSKKSFPRPVLLYKTDLFGHTGIVEIIDTGGNTAVLPPNMQMFGYSNDSINVPARKRSFDFSPSDGDLIHCNGVYHEYNYGSHLTVTKVSQTTGEVRWQRSFNMGVFVEPMFVLATQDGGCLITGYSNAQNETTRKFFGLKLNAEGMLGIEEEKVDVRPYFSYPNPVGDIIHMEFSPDVEPRAVELYDIQGRLLRTQNSGFENIGMENLPAGTYTLRVIMEDGTTYSDKVVKQ